MNCMGGRDAGGAARRDRRGGPFPHASHGQNCRTLKWRWIEGAGGVAEMVIGEQQLSSIPLQFTAQQILLKELLAKPERHGHLERPQTAGREGEVSLQQALEFQERLVIEHRVIDLVQRYAFLRQAVFDGMRRKSGIVLLAAEALFLGRRDNLAVADQGSRAVMIERGNAENSHEG